MRRAMVALGLMLGLAGCGGGGGGPSSPTSPAPTPVSGWPAGTVVELVSGRGGVPVSGATMLVGGAPVAAGTPLATAAPPGTAVDVTATGHLVRETAVRTGETRLVLWPSTSDFTAGYTRALVYTQDGTAEPVPLRRLPARVHSVAVQPSAQIQADPAAMEAHREAAAALTQPGVGITYVVGGTADFTVPTRIEPGYKSCEERTRALALIWLGSSGEITRTELVFCRADTARSAGTVAHELGHTFGLRHSRSELDLMAPYYRASRAVEPTGREVLTMALMFQRRPGNVWPDNDRDAAAAAVRFEVVE